MSKKEKKTVITILFIIIINIATKLLGFVRDAYIGQVYQQTAEIDTYFVSLNLTTMSFLSIGSAIVITTIPVIISVKNNENRDKVLSGLLTYFLAFSLGGILVYNLFGDLIVKIFANKFSSELAQVTRGNLTILSVTLLFICVTYFSIALLQANEHFKLPAMISIPYNLLIILFLYFFGQTKGIRELAIITSVGWLLQMLITMPTTIKTAGFKFRPNFKNTDGLIYKSLLGIIQIVLVLLTTQANISISNSFLTGFESGSVSAYYYAQTIFVGIVTIIVYAISAVMFPKFNDKINVNRQGFFCDLSQVGQCVIVLMLPITICLILFSQPLVEIIFLRGNFAIDNAQLTANFLKILSLYMIAYGFLDVLNRGYFTLGDKRTPIIGTAIILCTTFTLNYIFIKVFELGVYFISVSTVVSYFTGVAVSSIMFSKKYGNLGVRNILKSFMKGLVASLGMIITYLILHNAFGAELSKVGVIQKLFVLFIEGISVVSVYVCILVIIKEKNIYEFITKLKNKQ